MNNRTKTGGRTIGTPNKIQNELRVKIKNLIEKEFEDIDKTLSELSVEKRIEFLAKLLPFALPKMTEYSMVNNSIEERTREINIIIHKGDEE